MKNEGAANNTGKGTPVLFEIKNYSEMSSEINMDYLSDEGQQITQLLIGKYRPLLDENSMSSGNFSTLELSK